MPREPSADPIEARVAAVEAENVALQSQLAALSSTVAAIARGFNANESDVTKARPADCQQIRASMPVLPADDHFYIWPHGPTGRPVYVFCDFEGEVGWTVLLGGGNEIDNCEFISGDCDEAANGHLTDSLAGDAGNFHRGDKSASPSHAKFCCNQEHAIADQVSYHREFCGDTGG